MESSTFECGKPKPDNKDENLELYVLHMGEADQVEQWPDVR